MQTAAQLRLQIDDERSRLKASPYLAAVIAGKPFKADEAGAIPTVPARRRSMLDARPRRYFGGPRKPYQRSPDRAQALVRRRKLAWRSSAMPDKLRMQLTEAERAYASLVRADHDRQGYFDRCHDEAAALIGCCAKTVQRAQHRLKALGLIEVDHRPQPGRQKHLPNIITIKSPEWLAWIARGPRQAASIEGGHSCPATQTDNKKGSSFANSVPVAVKRYNDDACGVASFREGRRA